MVLSARGNGPPCELRGGIIVRHVYAADLFSIVLRGPRGQSTRDDLTLALANVRTATITRRLDPPPHALRLFDADARDGQTFAEGLGPCPLAREAARRMIAAADAIECRIPVTGAGWLAALGPGARVYGEIILITDDDGPKSLAAELLRAGFVST